MTLVYRVEELLALRDSVSESAVSIEKFADEEVIKEHVLRPSVSASIIATHPENTCRQSITANLVAGASANKKPSPSPSVKRGEAERLLKEHGSPQGMRVTASGCVVPSDLQPLSSPRYTYNTSKSQTSNRVSPIQGLQSQSVLDFSKVALNGPFVYNSSGQICHYVNNQFLPLNIVDGQIKGYISPPNSLYPFVPLVSGFVGQQSDSTMLSVPGSLPGFSVPPSRNASPVNPFAAVHAMDIPSRLQALKSVQATKNVELKQLERQEVLQAEHRDEAWRNTVIKAKMKFITDLDLIRKAIKELEAHPSSNGTPSPNPALNSQFHQPVAQPVFPMAQRPEQVFPQISLPVSSIGLQGNLYNSTTYMYPQFPPTAIQPSEISQYSSESRVFSFAEASLAGAGYQHPLATMSSTDIGRATGRDKASQSPTWPNSATRRSHAVEIKDPRDCAKKNVTRGSSLNPTSPTYEPAKTLTPNIESPPVFVPPTPSPIPSPKRNDVVQAKCPWLFDRKESSDPPHDKTEEKSIRHKPSISSVSTADFFPTNTHEHSSTRVAPPKTASNSEGSNRSASENNGAPITPEKNWPSSPWNQDYRSTGERKASTVSTQISPIDTRPTAWSQERNPVTEHTNSSAGTASQKPGWKTGSRPSSTPKLGPIMSAGGSSKTSAERSAAIHEISSPLAINSMHTPSTYQEGYQAGFLHREFPDDLEVLRGYADGLLASLKKDQSLGLGGFQGLKISSLSLKSKNSARQTNMRSYSPHDSGISLSFSSHEADQAAFAQENIRAINTNSLLPAATFGSTLNPSGSIWGVSQSGLPISYPFCHQSINAQKSRQHTSSVSTGGPLFSQRPEKLAQDQHTEVSSIDQNGHAHKTIKSHATQPEQTFSHIPRPKQFSRNQIRYSGKVTPLSLQRHYPGHKEYIPGTNPAIPIASARSGDQRFSSGYDGAIDELAELMEPVKFAAAEHSSVEASCFRSSSSRVSKQKTSTSPAKSSGSPKKSGEHSPAKAKLEQIANKVRRGKQHEFEPKDRDPAAMSGDKKKRWRDNWHKRFREIKNKEIEEIEQYKRENPLPN